MTFRMTIQEFADVEVVVGELALGTEVDLEFGRFDDDEIGIKVWRDGEPGSMCRLSDWRLA